MLPEEQAREKIDKQLKDAGWIVDSRKNYMGEYPTAEKEALMEGNKESDYLLFIENKAIAVIEAKREENKLEKDVREQAEYYANHPQDYYGLWVPNVIPLVYVSNGKKTYFKNLLKLKDNYTEITTIHSPKRMLQLIKKESEFGALPVLEKERGKKKLRDCQYEAELNLERSFRDSTGNRKYLAILATGAGKTYLACLASYRLLNYTPTKRILFLADRNNLTIQAESEFCLFDWTETNQPLSSIYKINRLRKKEDIKGNIIISTIQKLFAVLTGQELRDDVNEDEEDELRKDDENDKPIVLEQNLELPPDYFQFIIVDECHRSIYGKWRSVLDYFSGARILGLTATPTPEAVAFFDKKEIVNYTYEDSVVDGVNVPNRIYRISTKITEHGGSLKAGSEVQETSKTSKKSNNIIIEDSIEYQPNQLDRSIVSLKQIDLVLSTYRDAIYKDLYPEREPIWEYIPKTLIFAKDDSHASIIVERIKEIFKCKFKNELVPEKFVQKITYSAGDSNALIREFRIEKEFRIAVTVTLVATGTDIRPLEVVMFMKDVNSAVLYTQMKGRGCRTINDDKLKEVTPNAKTKECYYIVDAVGVTEHEKYIPERSNTGKDNRVLSLEILLEHLTHGELSDENLILLSNYCSTIQHRYEDNPLFSRHLTSFEDNFHFTPRSLAKNIYTAIENNSLEIYISPSGNNLSRKALINCLIGNQDAKKKLIEMYHGYLITTKNDTDEVIYAGFSKETARSFIANFEKYLIVNKDKIEALRIIYNSEEITITYSMLLDLRDRLLSENPQYKKEIIWHNYKILSEKDEVDVIKNQKVLTDLIQIVRYAFKKTQRLTSLFNVYSQRFNLYCGRAQRELSETQKQVMKKIADYIVYNGAISFDELRNLDSDLWKSAIQSFGKPTLVVNEMQYLSNFILKAA